MKSSRYILILSLLAQVTFAQYMDIVCSGDTSVYSVPAKNGAEYKWIIEGATIISQDNNKITVVWNVREGEYELEVTERSKFGCDGIPTKGSVFVSAPQLSFDDDEIVACEGEDYLIELDDNFEEYYWNGEVGTNSYLATESSNITVEAVDLFGCEVTDQLSITFNPLPEVDLGEDFSLCGFDQRELGVGLYPEIKWQIGDAPVYETNPVVTAGPKRITVTVTDFNNCQNSDTVNLLACDIRSYLLPLPNTITPNGDGENDYWVLMEDLNQVFSQVDIEIFDRWGRLVFKSAQYNNEFNGRDLNGRELPMDSYQYIINLNEPGVPPITGSISIVR